VAKFGTDSRGVIHIWPPIPHGIIPSTTLTLSH
jgi:hypothetical protein